MESPERPDRVDPRPHADSSAGGLHTHFRGPFADGPPPEALLIDAPQLDAFGLAELRRMLTVWAILALAVIRGLVRKARHWREGSALYWVATAVVDAFFVLGPTYVKVGQIIASSPGLFPDDLSRPAMRCLQEVPPFSSAIVRQVITEDLGRTPTQIFRSFEDTPLSAASVGQVHACVLPDGREAVVKIQRPNIHERMNLDLRIVYQLAKLIQKTDIGRRANAEGQIRDLHKLTNQELNMPLEAHRQHRFREGLHAFGDNETVTAPEVYWEYCGPRMICMERVYGVPMDDFEALEKMGVDARANLRRGMKAWIEALAVHGPFHGDLHAGNIWTLEDGRSCFLDFGIMGELEPAWQEMIRDILYTFMIDEDFTRIVQGYKKLGVIDPNFGTDDELARLMAAAFAPIIASEMKDLNFADLFQQSLEMAEQFGDISSPEELTLLGKQFLYFERYVKGIAPDYLIVRDPYLVKNVFPEAAAEKMAKLQADDPAAVVDPDNPPDPSAAPLAAAPPGAAPSAAAPLAGQIVLPEVDYDGPRYEFLSAGWFAAVERLRAEAPAVPDEAKDLVVNATVVGGPEGDCRVHLRAGQPDRGHAPDAETVVTMPYAVARSLIVSLDPSPVMQAMMNQEVTVEGDLTKVMAMQTQVLNPSEEQLQFAARIRALTRVD